MRGCLFVLLLAALVLGGIAFVGLQPAASGFVHAGLVASGLRSDDLRVVVTADPPTELVGLRADHVTVTATEATWNDIGIGRLELDLADVHLGERTFAAIEGTLAGVSLPPGDADAEPLPLELVTLSGSQDETVAVARADGGAVATRIADRIEAEVGAPPTGVRLEAPDRLAIALPIGEVAGSLVIVDGSLVLRPDVDLLGEIVLVEGPTDPLRLTSVRVVDGDLELTGDLALPLLGG